MKVCEMTCKTACNKIAGGRLPYKWDLNIYRGCSHHCRYCFAMYSHIYLGDAAYFKHIYVKTNIVERLEEMLSRPSWKREVINLGGVTDSYQPVEAERRIMPEILKLLIRYKTPAIISTKSDLILRDHDLIAELARITYVNVASTITTVREDVRTKLEPGTVSSERRFKMLDAFCDTKASRAVHMMPIVPLLTDISEDMDTLFEQANAVKASYILPGLLNLRGITKSAFLDFIRVDYPELHAPLCELYKTGAINRDYATQFYHKINELKARHNLSSNYLASMQSHIKQECFEQLSLF